MDAVWMIPMITGVLVMLYASSRLRAQMRSGWVEVFTPVHGGEELAIDFRSALTARGVESRTRYPGVAGSPGIGMSGATEVWVSVRRADVVEARIMLGEMLDARQEKTHRQGDDE